MELNKEDTRDFLQMVFSDAQVIEDDTFWTRLASRITFDMLVGAGEVGASKNLNRLMDHLAERIHLSHAALDIGSPELFEDLAWSLHDEFLRLRGPGWICQFTPHGNRFSQRRNEGDLVSLAEVARRTEGLLVEDAEIEEAARRVQLTRTELTD